MFRRRIAIVSTCFALGVGLLIAGEPHPTAATAATPGVQTTGRVWAAITAGIGHTCGIRRDRTLWCWGLNDAGQLGLGDMAYRTVPTQVGTGADWARIDAGLNHTCGIRTDDTLWCWGNNDVGQLGLGDTTDRWIPPQVGAESDWARIEAGGTSYEESPVDDVWPRGHTCAIRTDHTLWCWGFNHYSQLGLGDQTDRYSPTQVGTDTDWARITTGDMHTCGTRTDHTLWCWGDNDDGQLGLGDWSRRSTPTQVGTDTDWVGISAGGDNTIGGYTCGIRTNHTLWCWGANYTGQLGLGDKTKRTSPTQVGTGTDWVGIATGGDGNSGQQGGHTCGTRTDHTLWCWGGNRAGELGLGDRKPRKTPVQVGSGTDWGWAGVGAGNAHTCAIRTQHTLWCWGGNASGQLGLGDTTDRLYPRQV